jgi:hypothetical protein
MRGIHSVGSSSKVIWVRVIGIAVAAWVLGWADAYAGEFRVNVSASRVVGETETVQGVRRALEGELRKECLRRAPTVVEWDRELTGDVYQERVREMVLATVRLEGLSQDLTITKSGSVQVGLKGIGVVDDESIRAWASRVSETERLRAEVADARRATEAALSRTRVAGESAGASVESPSSAVRLRLGDASQLAAIAEGSARSEELLAKESVQHMLKSGVVSLGSIDVEKRPGSKWTGFAFALSWQLDGIKAMEDAYSKWMRFSAGDSVAGLRFFEIEGSNPKGGMSGYMRQNMLWSRIDLEITSGKTKKLVPIAYPAYRVGLIGETACVRTYGRDFAERANQTTDMGWCMLARGDAKAERNGWSPDVHGQSTMWVSDEDVPSMRGPDVDWVVRWADGKVDRIPAVLQWTGRLASTTR